ncbi:MAG: FAD-dependent monooxygenase [Deltaproteobacteria bacterium]
MAENRSDTLPKTTDVLIVGAGPTGLTLACRLAQAGVSHVVVDSALEGVNTSRAAVLHAGTLEALDVIGATDLLLRAGRTISDFALRDNDETLLRLDLSVLPSEYAYSLILPQSRTEAVLASVLARFGKSVLRPWRAVSLDQDRDGVTVRLAREQGTEPAPMTAIRARYVLGCDGMHSRVREACEIPFLGSAHAESFVLADVRMHWSLPVTQSQLFVSDGGVLAVTPLPGDQYRVVATLDPAPEQPTREDIEGLLRRRGPTPPAVVHDLVWGGCLRVHRRLAERYRLGRVLLAGDAAHVHSPAVGQGVNIGIQDALALGDHVIHALSTSAPPPELDAYERVRRPVAEAGLRLTDRLTRIALLRSPVFRLLRNRTVAALGRSARFRQRLHSSCPNWRIERALRCGRFSQPALIGPTPPPYSRLAPSLAPAWAEGVDVDRSKQTSSM